MYHSNQQHKHDIDMLNVCRVNNKNTRKTLTEVAPVNEETTIEWQPKKLFIDQKPCGLPQTVYQTENYFGYFPRGQLSGYPKQKVILFGKALIEHLIELKFILIKKIYVFIITAPLIAYFDLSIIGI